MGIFDLLSPVLVAIDDAMALALPPFARLVAWAAISSAAAMGTYWLCSAQARLDALKGRIAALRREILAYDGELAGLRPLLRQSIALSFRQVAMTFWPSAVASLPMLFLIAWLGNVYSFELPEPGQLIDVVVRPATAGAYWDEPARAAALPTAGPVEWPRAGLDLYDATGIRLLSLPPVDPIPVVHKWQWWNVLFGNPLGYLPDAGAVERVEFDLPRVRFLDFGPDWLDRWETIYFALLVMGSLTIKFAFRIR